MPHSRFLTTLERDGVVAVFHSLTPNPVFFPKDLWEQYLDDPDRTSEVAALLKAEGLLPDSIEEDDEMLQTIREETIGHKFMSILYLILTKNCNFRCRQCFQEERHPDLYPAPPSRSRMSEQVARLALDAFARHLAESEDKALEPQIQLYGGEPLLNQKTLRFAVSYARKLQSEGTLPADLQLIIVTNGSLVTEDIARYFAENRIGVGLSVDGPAIENDEYRRTAKGQGTYAAIVQALRLLQQHGVSVTLSVTVNPNIVGKLPEIIRWAKQDMGVESIGFNPIGGKSFGYTGTPMKVETYGKTLAAGLVEAFCIGRDIDLYEDRVGRKVDDFIAESFRAVDCGAVGNQLVVFPDGGIGFCHASEDYRVGTVFDPMFRIFQHQRIEAWKAALPLRQPMCLTCPAISVCGYGCFHNVLEAGKPLEDRDTQFCLHSRTVMDFLVWDLYEKARAET